MIKIVKSNEVVPATGGTAHNFAIGYMSADMSRVTDWYGAELGSARVVTGWRMTGSYLSSRMYQVEATIDGVEYTGRTMGAYMLWRGRRVRRDRVGVGPFAKSDRGRERRAERKAAIAVKCGEIGQ